MVNYKGGACLGRTRLARPPIGSWGSPLHFSASSLLVQSVRHGAIRPFTPDRFVHNCLPLTTLCPARTDSLTPFSPDDAQASQLHLNVIPSLTSPLTSYIRIARPLCTLQVALRHAQVYSCYHVRSHFTRPPPNTHLVPSGGGIAGLCLATVLLKHGDIRVDVYEASSKFEEVGAGLTLWGRVCEALRLMDLADDCMKAAVIAASTSGLPTSMSPLILSSIA